MSLPHTSELELEMEQARARWVRRRFLWLVGISLLLSAPFLLLLWVSIPADRQDRLNIHNAHLVRTWWATLSTGLYVVAAIVVILKRNARDSARFTTKLAIALITLIAALAVPIERYAAGIEGAYSLEQLANQQRNASGTSTGSDAIDSFRAGFQEGLNSGRRSTTTSTQPAQPPTTLPARHNAEIPLRTGVMLNIDTSDLDEDADKQLSPTTAQGAPGTITRTTQKSKRDPFDDFILRTVFTPGVRTALFGIYVIFITHLISCIFMPWTVRESLIPGVAALGGFSLVLGADLFAGQLGLTFAAITLASVTACLVPGTVLCWWRYSRFRGEFRLQFESGRYKELRGELASARKIHETCLPEPILTGPVRVAYAYRPMSDIGGDLLVSRRIGTGPDAPVLVAIIDVTGHGIAAALTVNRLLGELDRVIGASADPEPGQVLSALNTYTRLMLSHHGLYLSACVFRLEPKTRTLRYASGGHPTAYRLNTTSRPTGQFPRPHQPADPHAPSPQDLDSTATLLGVLSPEDYDPGETTLTLAPGEIIIACTDGATETRDADGQLLRTAGVRTIVQEIVAVSTIPPESIPEAVLSRLDRIRPGDAEDDTLIVMLRFA